MMKLCFCFRKLKKVEELYLEYWLGDFGWCDWEEALKKAWNYVLKEGF